MYFVTEHIEVLGPESPLPHSASHAPEHLFMLTEPASIVQHPVENLLAPIDFNLLQQQSKFSFVC